ncbi:MAG TPA: GDP-mannose 4,6-dehydratase [Tepidisphaeraceae bacterium]
MSKQKVAFITGITGQDGSYLAELLLEKGYRVAGMWRKSSAIMPLNASHLLGSVEFVYGDLLDSGSLVEAIRKYRPDEVYNLAAQSYPGESWRLPIQTAEITGLGAHRLFEAVKQVDKSIKVYQASSSEMYGKVRQIPQDENTAFEPINPYAAAKLYAHSAAKIYRESFDMFIACGILFNHESPRRGMHFITQKVTHGAACIKLGIRSSPVLNEEGEPIVKDGKLAIGNLEAKRDWGFAGDYVEAMWMMMQQPKPDDFVIATNQTWSIRQLCEQAFRYVGLDWEKHVVVDARFVRPTETGPLVGNADKALRELGWKPKTRFADLIAMMVDTHLARLK